ncbi:MAG: YggS family pyridoxal phosphate-dependent enzyme [Flavobacteriia bacterium]|nr:YggS family pyridoxal phosphate-dependent enzyme [Flavobacteriia bacterium]
MSNLIHNLNQIKNSIPTQVTLIVVSKTRPVSEILELYNSGQKDFGENRVQELIQKHESLPKEIHWHLIGHLQTNKVKLIASFVHLIHSVDSFKLLVEIDKEAKKHNRTIDCLLQMHIAQEETKFGMNFEEVCNLLENDSFIKLDNIRIVGLMGMASNVIDQEQIRTEFQSLYNYFQVIKSKYFTFNPDFEHLSMGMSSDYKIAIEFESTMIRVGSIIFN